MSALPILYGWHLSYYTGKVLCYLRHKRIRFVDQPVDLLTLTRRIRRRTGAVVMPVLVDARGEWLQDSSVIIDRLEAEHPGRSIHPATPVQRFVSYLFEAWGDEWWVPIAMHTRWSHAENYALFERDAGAALLPHWPAWLQRRAVARVARNLRGYLPSVGVRAEQIAVMDGWTARMLDLLDAHFARHDFLLGGRPCLGDFGLVGTMYGHLGRDPWPARELVAPRQHLRRWIDRMAGSASPGEPSPDTDGDWLADDAVAPTLLPVLRCIFDEFVPMLDGINQQVRALLPELPPGKALPRALADVEMPMGSGRFRRAAMPYSLWMAQRTLDAVRDMLPADRQRVHAWLAEQGGAGLLALDIPRLRRKGLRVMPY